MVSEEKIRGNALAREGIKMLAQSGILKETLTDLLANLISGDPNEPEEELIERVREYRRVSGVLMNLQEIGDSFVEENQNEPR